MRINMVSFEDGIIASGFRKMAGFMERVEPDTRVYYVGTARYRSVWKSLFRTSGEKPAFGPDQIDQIAQELAKGDVAAFSSMTGYADLARKVIRRVREINPHAYIMWGGVHSIIYPEDAITADVDAICTGEGEFAFAEWMHHQEAGTDFRNIHNMWFKDRKSGEITRNPQRPLMTPAEMETLPFPKYAGAEWMYRADAGFTPVTLDDYLDNNGLGYPTVWSIGCPLHCTFCGNTVFIGNDPKYAKVRHTSAAYIVGEVESVRKKHPHVSTVLFNDDSFMALPMRDLVEFAEMWREKVRVPFVVFGVIPTYVQREKMEVLTWAGLQRVRMGIQSGSERILNFYKRPVPIAKVEAAAKTISEFRKFQINPVFDLIVDNPVETREDVKATLELIYRMARPFNLSLFSLKIIPNTVLAKDLAEAGIDLDHIDSNFLRIRPTWSNLLPFLLLWWKPPRWIFDQLLKKVRAPREEQQLYPLTFFLVRIPWSFLQGMRHLRWGEFSVITGKAGYLLWKAGILPLWWKLFRPRYKMPKRDGAVPPQARPAPEASGAA